MRVVVGWVGSGCDIALDRLDDINLALETLVGGDTGAGGSLSLRVWVEDEAMHLSVEGLSGAAMLANLMSAGTVCTSGRWPLDIRLFLRALVDEYAVVAGKEHEFGVSMRKGIR
jgi:hypothetical protein